MERAEFLTRWKHMQESRDKVMKAFAAWRDRHRKEIDMEAPEQHRVSLDYIFMLYDKLLEDCRPNIPHDVG